MDTNTIINGFSYLPQSERKKILFISDDIRTTSGVATMSKEIILGTCHYFNWFQIGGAINHPDKGKIIDVSESVKDELGIPDPYVKIIPVDGYGTQSLIRELMMIEKPNALIIYTDPRQFGFIFEMENEIRQQIPIFYYNIWDAPPPPFYNQQYYESVDLLMNISKQTHNLVKIVVGDGNYEEI